jgi:radical SAM superfamily enzyme YgiQ (UPF0313 family)
MDPEGTLRKMPAVDYAFIGESEQSLPIFVKAVKEGREDPLPEEIRGIAFRQGSKGNPVASIKIRECSRHIKHYWRRCSRH